LRILCVEDHGDTCYLLKRLLELHQHTVRACATVAEAKAALSADGADRYDLLICDLMLPDGDGFEVMKVASRLGVPGVALSAVFVGERDRQHSRGAGFLTHLNKPIVYEELAAILEQVGSTPLPRGEGPAAWPTL
jgi:CheY-like chemotaxis protein